MSIHVYIYTYDVRLRRASSLLPSTPPPRLTLLQVFSKPIQVFSKVNQGLPQSQPCHTVYARASNGEEQLTGFPSGVTHARPFEPPTKSHFWKISSTSGDKCPQNGSNTAPRAPRPHLGCPH